MAPSQLKQLKASLRQNGVLAPQKSKKQKKASSKDGKQRRERILALESIREKFNPFEAKAPARKEKFEFSSGKSTKKVIERPGVTRGLGEERRRDTLLREMQSRNKVGGMLDRRFGENDPTMSLEEKNTQRSIRQALRRSNNSTKFNLEDEGEEMVLTHGGQSLDFDKHLPRDDFQEELDGSEEEDFDARDDRPRKRARIYSSDEHPGEETEDIAYIPERKKTKNEVMKEVIAKSKMHKAMRQAAQQDDDDLRAKLDKDTGDLYAALREHKPASKRDTNDTTSEPSMDPSRAAMLAGKSREDAEKEYETNLRQLKLDARSKPSVRTKTEDEIAAEQKARLEELERKRQRRMRGEAESSEDEQEENNPVSDVAGNVDTEDGDDEVDDAEEFGLVQPEQSSRVELDVEDEDEFVLDDIIADGSDVELDSDLEENSESHRLELEDDGDDDFINGLVLPKALEPQTPTHGQRTSGGLAYTYPCPQSHAEFLGIIKSAATSDLPTIVQRIRALYHKGLAQENQAKLANLARVLVQHLAYMANEDNDISYQVLDSLTRHLHSMAKSQPEDVGIAFRVHLRDIATNRPLALSAGDLVILTAISTIFPTSDHFHSVVTPAMLAIARYLGQSSIENAQDLARAAYACSLALQYQNLSKRYTPEVILYIVNAMSALAPIPLPQMNTAGQSLLISIRRCPENLRLKVGSKTSSQPTPAVLPKISFDQLRPNRSSTLESEREMILLSFIRLSKKAAELWSTKTAIPEILAPVETALSHLLQPASIRHLSATLAKSIKDALSTISSIVSESTAARKPLLLHSHRPLAIKSSLPSFIENFNPDRHYDPDRDRAESAKLRHEHKKERKGAMRELRKDANFIAREKLRETKAKDEAYEKKFKRLVAEINAEGGADRNEYEKNAKKQRR